MTPIQLTASLCAPGGKKRKKKKIQRCHPQPSLAEIFKWLLLGKRTTFSPCIYRLLINCPWHDVLSKSTTREKKYDFKSIILVKQRQWKRKRDKIVPRAHSEDGVEICVGRYGFAGTALATVGVDSGLPMPRTMVR